MTCWSSSNRFHCNQHRHWQWPTKYDLSNYQHLEVLWFLPWYSCICLLSLACSEPSVGGCFLFGWKLVNTYCKLDCRPIQLFPIILYQNNYIWGCPVNYFDLDLPEVWLTLCVYSRSTNKKKPSPTQGMGKATKGLMWWNQHHILTTTHSNDWLI